MMAVAVAVPKMAVAVAVAMLEITLVVSTSYGDRGLAAREEHDEAQGNRAEHRRPSRGSPAGFHMGRSVRVIVYRKGEYQ